MVTLAYSDGANGHGLTWAVRGDDSRPEPPIPDPSEWDPAPPPGALLHVMDAVEADESPRSYVQASLFVREIEELGAQWHGISWGTHSLLDNSRVPGGPPVLARRRDAPDPPAEGWSWEAAPPADWRPQVRERDGGIEVRFHTRSDFGTTTLFEHVDMYWPTTGLRPHTTQRALATAPSGFMF